MQLHSAYLAGWVHPADVFVQFYAKEPAAFWLDREHAEQDRFSVIGSGNVISNPNNSNADYVTLALARLGYTSNLDLPFPWRPGLVGSLSYEGHGEFIEASRAIVFDHKAQGMYFAGIFESQEDFDFWHHAALLRLGLSGGQVASYLHAKTGESKIARSTLRHSETQYLAMISSAQQHISIGDVYQVCLTNEITIETSEDPLAVFLRLRNSNPAPYSTYLKLGNLALASSSPEQFLKVQTSGEISTKPIKGTRPRGTTPALDAAIAAELQSDAKERAENLMIVDLMRNDIGKVSRVGTVAVPKLFEIETYATVHQLVSTVTGQLEDSETAWSAVLAAFPGGSMTGAPKIRAMEIIGHLEKGPRGIYSGCLGYLAADGSAEFAMTIRSIVFKDGVATIGVGGGITIDSDPKAELEETKLKAKALLAALNAADPWA
jgi:aminodeoxychorismate synthase component I